MYISLPEMNIDCVQQNVYFATVGNFLPTLIDYAFRARGMVLSQQRIIKRL